MQVSQLDFYFPFIVFFYGLFAIFMMDFPPFQEARRRIASASGAPAAYQQFMSLKASKPFLYFMTIFSGLWAAQNLYF